MQSKSSRLLRIAPLFIMLATCGEQEEAAPQIPIHIKKYSVSTFAGGVEGYADGIGSEARFSGVDGITPDDKGHLYTTEAGNYIRRITSNSEVSTFAGSGRLGSMDGDAATAEFKSPSGITVDRYGNLYVADTYNHKIRKVTSEGTVTTFAGSGVAGFEDGIAAEASFNNPTGVALDATGNIYVVDEKNHAIRKIDASGVVSTFAGNGVEGNIDGRGAEARFNLPRSITIDSQGNLYIVDSFNHSIRKISTSGEVNTFAGNGYGGFADGPGVSAQFSFPRAIAIDEDGNLYIADSNNYRIRKITPAGAVSTIAGTGSQGLTDGDGTEAQFSYPNGIAVADDGNIYVTEWQPSLIRKITVQ